MRTHLVFVALLSAAFLASHSAAQVMGHAIYEFSSSQTEPLGVVAGPNGVLYGMAAAGHGSVFELQPPAAPGGPWTEATLYTFTGQNGDGSNGWPSMGVLAVDASGNIYGTTTGGGAYGGGTVFELQPPQSSGGAWTETVLYSFPPSGGFGFTAMVIVEHGVLYGVYTGGGAYGLGMIFELHPPTSSSGGLWVFSTLYSFTGGNDGGYPGVLTRGLGGKLYGSTGSGGSTGQGVVFELSPPAVPGKAWTETVLYNFLGGEAGSGSVALVMGSDGYLYGATASTIFQLIPPAMGSTTWTETTLYSFWSNSLGGPDSTIVERNGMIYVTASTLFCLFSCSGGGVYRLQPSQGGGPWTSTLLHEFYGAAEPWGSIAMDQKGTLFGAALGGPDGATGYGFVYELKP